MSGDGDGDESSVRESRCNIDALAIHQAYFEAVIFTLQDRVFY